MPVDAGDEAHVDVAFSPDGDLTVSRVRDDDGGALVELVSYDTDALDDGATGLFVNDEPRLLASPQWSDDGSTLAALEVHSAMFGEPDTSVLVLDEHGEVDARLFDEGQAPDGPAAHELGGLTPDGQEVLVTTTDDELAHSILRLVDVGTGAETRLVDEGDLDTSDDRSATILRAHLSPDGDRVVFDDADVLSLGAARQFVDGRVLLVDADGGDFAEQEPQGVNRGLPSWSPTAD